MTSLNTKLYIAPVELHRTKKLPPDGKEYLCFQINSKYPHAAKCIKSQKLDNSIYSILSVDTFEQQYAVNKDMLQSTRREDHMKTIGIYQSLCNSSSFEPNF